MAKADDKSSTIDRISLCGAKERAAARFLSKELAEKRLRWDWMATGELPWGCEEWKGLDAKSLAEMRRPEGFRNSMGHVIASLPSAAYCPGDPGFWRANLKIDWEDNGAHEVESYGAKALGIFVTRSRLLALLHEDAEVPSASAKWAAATTRRLRREKKIPEGILKAELARVLEIEAQTDVKTGQISRALKASYLEDQLRPWGIWPLDRFE